MKGMVVLEVAAMAIIAVVVIYVVYNMFIGEPNTKSNVKYSKDECAYHSDCIENINGNLCLEGGIPIPAVFCGCLSKSNCNGRPCGGNNKCV